MWGCWGVFFHSLPGVGVVINGCVELNSLGWLTVGRDSRVGGSCNSA